MRLPEGLCFCGTHTERWGFPTGARGVLGGLWTHGTAEREAEGHGLYSRHPVAISARFPLLLL